MPERVQFHNFLLLLFLGDFYRNWQNNNTSFIYKGKARQAFPLCGLQQVSTNKLDFALFTQYAVEKWYLTIICNAVAAQKDPADTKLWSSKA